MARRAPPSRHGGHLGGHPEQYGVEVVPHLICGGLSKYDIEDTLIDMDFLGLHNVLALRGDKSQNEKRFMPHPQGHATPWTSCGRSPT